MYRKPLVEVIIASLVLLTAAHILACSDDNGGASQASTTTPYVRLGLTPAVVTRVVDGDTIRVEIDGDEYRLRYIGIDAPETGQSGGATECFSNEATERNRDLVDGQTVGLEKDISETDGFDRLLRYVWLEDSLVNAVLVEEGYALARKYPPDTRHNEQLAALQTRAREASLGIWGPPCHAP